MPRARKRPTLRARMSPDSEKTLTQRVARINQAGDAAREKLAARTGGKPGKKPAKRVAQLAGGIEREIEQAKRRWDALVARGAWDEADRVEATLAVLHRRLRRAKRADQQAAGRKARLDRFAVMVRRSAVLTEWHWCVADRWLQALDEAADGLMERPADVEAAGADDEETARDPVTGRRLPPHIDGPAIFLRGRSVLDRWGKAVPVSDVRTRGRKVPGTFDPKPVKAPRRAPRSGLQEGVLKRRGEAERLTAAFSSALHAAGHPDWCEAVAIRVILENQGTVEAMKALGIGVWSATRNQLQTAVAAGLCGVARALGLPVEN